MHATRTLTAVFTLLLAAPAPASDARCLVEAARAQIGVTLHYDPAYRSIDYPGGDVAPDRGVCTDVLVRAYRALGHDLQALVHEDMRVAWDRYPKLWGLARPDPSIDHRRVPNLAAFLSRHGRTLEGGLDPERYAAGDIVTWRLDSGVPHIGMVSDRTAPSGTPLVIHNIGRGTVEEDILFAFTITAHYRYLPPAAPGLCPAAEGVPASPPATGTAPGTAGADRPARGPGA